MISIEELKIKINRAASKEESFLFVIDYELTKGEFIDNPIDSKEVMWRAGNHTNVKEKKQGNGTFFKYDKTSYQAYSHKFDYVKDQLKKGNSFLANLTVKTPIETDYSLEEIFYRSNSPYALFLKNQFVCFSPETFVQITDGKISSNPMKGTISGAIENAEQVILNDYKESAEHYTIVDFIRSDLSRVSTNINVDKLRYIDRLKTSHGEVLQVSSHISGDLPNDYTTNLADVLFKLLPAGSISGAPKQSTVEILKKAEGEPRGFYTGIFGYFDGKNLDSAVMIRFIEKEDEKLFFRSGGGITINSRCEEEYNEVHEKIYLPFI